MDTLLVGLALVYHGLNIVRHSIEYIAYALY